MRPIVQASFVSLACTAPPVATSGSQPHSASTPSISRGFAHSHRHDAIALFWCGVVGSAVA